LLGVPSAHIDLVVSNVRSLGDEPQTPSKQPQGDADDKSDCDDDALSQIVIKSVETVQSETVVKDGCRDNGLSTDVEMKELPDPLEIEVFSPNKDRITVALKTDEDENFSCDQTDNSTKQFLQKELIQNP